MFVTTLIPLLDGISFASSGVSAAATDDEEEDDETIKV